MEPLCYCWWCCHPFDWKPIHFPYAFTSNTFHTTGNFCSWGCLKAYGLGRGDIRTIDLVTLMRKRTEGKIKPIKSAPSRYCLKMFGGPVSIEEFRSEIPVFTHIPGESFQEPISQAHNEITNLQLKREKPLRRSNKLENSLGIIIRKKCLTGSDAAK
jgi:hypothetical protein